MRNRRKVSRFHLLRPLTGYIEREEDRRRGEIIEFSTAGFRHRLRDTPQEAFAYHGGDLREFGEVLYKDSEIGGFGEVRYVHPAGRDLCIGFKWDEAHASAQIQTSFALIAELVSQRNAGCVNVGDGVIKLAGHVSSVLCEDLNQSIASHRRRISLAECTSIDTSGLAMLTRLENEGMEIIGASGEVFALLQQYKLRRPAPVAPPICLPLARALRQYSKP